MKFPETRTRLSAIQRGTPVVRSLTTGDGVGARTDFLDSQGDDFAAGPSELAGQMAARQAIRQQSLHWKTGRTVPKGSARRNHGIGARVLWRAMQWNFDVRPQLDHLIISLLFRAASLILLLPADVEAARALDGIRVRPCVGIGRGIPLSG